MLYISFLIAQISAGPLTHYLPPQGGFTLKKLHIQCLFSLFRKRERELHPGGQQQVSQAKTGYRFPVIISSPLAEKVLLSMCLLWPLIGRRVLNSRPCALEALPSPLLCASCSALTPEVTEGQ